MEVVGNNEIRKNLFLIRNIVRFVAFKFWTKSSGSICSLLFIIAVVVGGSDELFVLPKLTINIPGCLTQKNYTVDP